MTLWNLYFVETCGFLCKNITYSTSPHLVTSERMLRLFLPENWNIVDVSGLQHATTQKATLSAFDCSPCEISELPLWRQPIFAWGWNIDAWQHVFRISSFNFKGFVIALWPWIIYHGCQTIRSWKRIFIQALIPNLTDCLKAITAECRSWFSEMNY